MAPGVDFPKALIQGLTQRYPENLADVEIFVNTGRMQRRIREILDAGPARLLPRIRLVTDIGRDFGLGDLPPAIPALRRRLELTRLVTGLLEQQPDLAPRTAVFDLADSLADLMDEMHGEGVSAQTIADLDVTDQSGHWQRALNFLQIVQRYCDSHPDVAIDAETRQRKAIELQIKRWLQEPPDHPIVMAGSTGSRGATHLLIEAISQLPHGTVVLPGFDFDLPAAVWDSLDGGLGAQDHPQYRFRHLMRTLSLAPADIRPWCDETPPAPSRNRLVSMSLRPAPVTDQWMSEGSKLTGLDEATADMTLLEAPSSRAEALAIAYKLRGCIEAGKTAALVTPDRVLTRQVTAALDRWRVEPDDSAGQPLHLSPPGRLLRQISSLFGRKLTSETLLALLKHPLTNTGGDDRGPHLRWTRELELHLRRHGPPFPTRDSLVQWAAQTKPDDGRVGWAEWLGGLFAGIDRMGIAPLSAHLEHHLALAAAITAGPAGTPFGALWDKAAGREARRVVEELEREASVGGPVSPSDYANLFRAVLARAEVRDPVRPHPGVMIWGTLEARVQGADLVILGGLNDGIWPQQPAPDPWLNREMRKQAGLLLPDRQIGLSAHDFQQAIAAKEVLLTRSVRDAEVETVPSRWLNRLTNLLDGLGKSGGEHALKAMCARGENLLREALALEAISEPVSPQNRPSPRPPIAARPKKLSVTRIKTLIRDPYAIYAHYVLRLAPLDPIHRTPDAPLRGTVLHSILEKYVGQNAARRRDRDEARASLLEIADQVLAVQAPWPAARRIWRAKLARVAGWFLETEERRLALASPIALEKTGETRLDAIDFTLTAKPDRIDRAADGKVYVYDYKTGTPPSKRVQKYFDKQLLLTAAMIERGAFAGVGNPKVAAAVYIGLGANPSEVAAPLDEAPPQKVWAGFETLISEYMNPRQGYTSRRAMQKQRYGEEFQHLARYGEWDDSMPPDPQDVK